MVPSTALLFSFHGCCYAVVLIQITQTRHIFFRNWEQNIFTPLEVKAFGKHFYDNANKMKTMFSHGIGYLLLPALNKSKLYMGKLPKNDVKIFSVKCGFNWITWCNAQFYSCREFPAVYNNQRISWGNHFYFAHFFNRELVFSVYFLQPNASGSFDYNTQPYFTMLPCTVILPWPCTILQFQFNHWELPKLPKLLCMLPLSTLGCDCHH